MVVVKDVKNKDKATLMEYQKTIHYFIIYIITLSQIVLINYQNGRSQTHRLATIPTKTPNFNEDLLYKTFRRLKKEEMTILVNDTCAAELLV